MSTEQSQSSVSAEGADGAVQGYLLRTESGDLYAIPLAELERFRLSEAQSTALEVASAEGGEVEGYCLGGGLGSVGPGFFSGGFYCLPSAAPAPASTPTVAPVYSYQYNTGRRHSYVGDGGVTG